MCIVNFRAAAYIKRYTMTRSSQKQRRESKRLKGITASDQGSEDAERTENVPPKSRKRNAPVDSEHSVTADSPELGPKKNGVNAERKAVSNGSQASKNIKKVPERNDERDTEGSAAKDLKSGKKSNSSRKRERSSSPEENDVVITSEDPVSSRLRRRGGPDSQPQQRNVQYAGNGGPSAKNRRAHAARGKTIATSAVVPNETVSSVSRKRKRNISVSPPSARKTQKPNPKPTQGTETKKKVVDVNVRTSKPEDHSYPCRDREFMEIYEFVREHIGGLSGGCMYIAGMPGTGKTATVRRVMEYLKAENQAKRIPDFIHSEINGMKLTDAKQAYSVLAKDVFDQPKLVGPANALRMLDRHYRSQNTKEKSSVVVIVDEMDLLYTKTQKVLYNLFEWPQQPNSQLIIISIANTMNLPEQMLMSRVESRLAFHRLAFQPYTRVQLEQVVRYHLKDTKLDDHAMLLAANKVASISGDARRVLEVCRTAGAIAERRMNTKSPAAKTNVPAVVQVTALDVDAACAELTTNDPIYNYLQSASGLEKAFLKSVVMEFERTGTEQAEMEHVLDHIRDHYLVAGKECPSVSSSLAVASTLAALHILFIETKCAVIESRISLNCCHSVVKEL